MAKNSAQPLRLATLRVSRFHFLYVAAIMAQIIIYDAWNLITPAVVLKRWLAAAGLLVVVAVVWFVAKSQPRAAATYRWLVLALIAADIALASFAVYTQRGMASRAVFLFIIPIVTSAVLMRRSAILATAAACVAAYTSTTISYFVLNFNEGYKIELYGEVGFYSVAMLLIAFLLWAVIKPQRSRG